MALKTTIKSLKEGFVVLYGDNSRDLRETEVFSTREAAEEKAKNLRAAYSIVQIFEAEKDHTEQLNRITESIEQHLDLDKLFTWIDNNKEEALEAWYEFEDEEANFNALRVVENFLTSIDIDFVSLDTEYGNKILEFTDKNIDSIIKKMEKVEYNFNDVLIDGNIKENKMEKLKRFKVYVIHGDNEPNPWDEFIIEATSKEEVQKLIDNAHIYVRENIPNVFYDLVIESDGKILHSIDQLAGDSEKDFDYLINELITLELEKEPIKELKESTNNDIKSILRHAYEGSYFTVVGAGGDLKEWFDGLNEMFAEEGIGQIKEYISFTGKDINEWARLTGTNAYADDLTFFAFPLDGLDAGKLPIFKLRFGARWFDDIVDNNANREGFHPMGKSHYDENLKESTVKELDKLTQEEKTYLLDYMGYNFAEKDEDKEEILADISPESILSNLSDETRDWSNEDVAANDVIEFAKHLSLLATIAKKLESGVLKESEEKLIKYAIDMIHWEPVTYLPEWAQIVDDNGYPIIVKAPKNASLEDIKDELIKLSVDENVTADIEGDFEFNIEDIDYRVADESETKIEESQEVQSTLTMLKQHKDFKDLEDGTIMKIIRCYARNNSTKPDDVDAVEIIDFIKNLGGWGPFVLEYVDSKGLGQSVIIELVKKDPKLLKAVKKFADDNNLLGVISSDTQEKEKTDDDYIYNVLDLKDKKVLPDTIKELSRLYYLDEEL